MPSPTNQIKGNGSSTLVLVFGVLLVSIVAGGSGIFAGWQIKRLLTTPSSRPAKVISASIDEASPIQVLPLASIVTNLATSNHWIRLNAVTIIGDTKPVAPDLPPQLAQDIIAVLRTLTLAHISGPNGLQLLREELLERLRLRSNGRVKDLMLESMVIE